MAIATVAYAEPPAIVRRESNGLQGREGKQIEAAVRQICEGLRHSFQWNKLLTATREEGQLASLDVADLAYGPAKRTYTKRVRYDYIGRGKPLPYGIDDDTME
jgi:hypothetical protein